MKTKAIIRLIVMIVLTVNAGLVLAGINPIPFDEAAFTEWATVAAAGISQIWSWWKNAPITSAAAEIQGELEQRKGKMQNNIEIEDREINGVGGGDNGENI